MNENEKNKNEENKNEDKKNDNEINDKKRKLFQKRDRVFQIILENKWKYLFILLLTVVVNILTLLSPLIIGYTTDELLSSKNASLTAFEQTLVTVLGGTENIKNNLWLLGAVLISIAAVIGILNYLKGKSAAHVSEHIAENLRNDLFKHLLNLPYSYFNKINTGDIIQRCTSDVDNIRMFFSSQLIEIIRIITLVIVALFYMLNFNVKLSIYSTFLLPFSFIFSLLFIKLFEGTFNNFEECEGHVNTTIQENVSGVRVVKAFNNQTYEIEKFSKVNENFNQALRKVLNAYAIFWSVSDLICMAQYVIAIVAGAYFGYKNIITPGEYVIFISYTTMLIWPVRQLGRVMSEFGKTRVAYFRLCDIFETEVENDLLGGGTPDLDGDIEFKNFSFKFDDEETYTLKNINFKINKGENVGILGSIGSGKSTLMHMLLRFHNYDEGSITINGHELKEVNKTYLRKNIGIALQDNFLYGKSIIENLRLANQEITEKEVFEIAKIANIHQTFKGFKDGYQTEIGEKGVTLSGGQKQRTTIARTLIKKTGTIIFDDSLSAVDPETDANIREQLKTINSNITTIIIAQRINTIMECDKIVVMDKGEITHIGTHEELINQDGIYKEVWDIQNMQSES